MAQAKVHTEMILFMTVNNPTTRLDNHEPVPAMKAAVCSNVIMTYLFVGFHYNNLYRKKCPLKRSHAWGEIEYSEYNHKQSACGAESYGWLEFSTTDMQNTPMI